MRESFFEADAGQVEHTRRRHHQAKCRGCDPVGEIERFGGHRIEFLFRSGDLFGATGRAYAFTGIFLP